MREIFEGQKHVEVNWEHKVMVTFLGRADYNLSNFVYYNTVDKHWSNDELLKQIARYVFYNTSNKESTQ